MTDVNSPPTPPQHQGVFLPSSVEQLINEICTDQKVPPLGYSSRRDLASVGEEKALAVLRTIASGPIKKSFDGFVFYLCKKITNNSDSPIKRLCVSPQSSPTPTPTRCMMQRLSETTVSVSSIPMQIESSNASVDASLRSNGVEMSPQLDALGELEFRKAFLILSYLGGTRLEQVLSADEIRGLKSLPMVKFEAEVWKTVGFKCGFIQEGERRKYLDWDSGKTHTYHCYVYPDGSCKFKGPYLSTVSNYLQRVLGDENVLVVKFSEEGTGGGNLKSSLSDCYTMYSWLAREGIQVGLRRYCFFVFKDGGKEEKRKDPTSSPVKCFFVRVESHASSDGPDYILCGKTIREARSLFMNVDTLPTLSKYMARFSLILSKTISIELDWSCIQIERIDDILCRDGDGNVLKDKDGKPLMLTDGTGFISEDLAFKCRKNARKGKYITTTTNAKPLLLQFRLFNNGSAVKGTFLVNKKLGPGTMQIRPSMIKVEPASTSNPQTKNSLEIVGTSNRPKRTYLSRNLIALLSYGGVPKEFFLNLLNNTLEEAKGALTNKRAALQAAVNYGEMDDFIIASMILSGIPLEESYLQHRLCGFMNEEKKNLRGLKIPVPESYYLMGTVDPTGLLKCDEVCIILENGHVSGKVLVYRNPGLHFGDIHILKATYVEALEEFVGNAKYAIFFPCQGSRSVADEIAGGDYDGDTYFVSRNPELLDKFKESERWTSSSQSSNMSTKKPSELSNDELESELFKYFLMTRFQPSRTVGLAADSWLAIMDRLLTLNNDTDEIVAMKKNIYQLIDKYYDALDAPKQGGGKIELPDELKADVFPHYMERQETSYRSRSILGQLYDEVLSFQEDNEFPVSEVWKLPCFEDKVSESCLIKWEKLYSEYRQEMTTALKHNKDACKEIKNDSADEIIKKYKQILYDAPNFRESKRANAEIFEEALAIHEVCYNYAKSRGDVSKCGFAWRVAGQALCKYYIITQGEQPITCSPSSLKEMFC